MEFENPGLLCGIHVRGLEGSEKPGSRTLRTLAAAWQQSCAVPFLHHFLDE